MSISPGTDPVVHAGHGETTARSAGAPRTGLEGSSPRPTPEHRGNRFAAERLAAGLGWFSIGLGCAELAAPGLMARLIGLPDDATNRRTLQALGVREMASGFGILGQARPAPWIWSRVAGDAMDLALLGRAAASTRTEKGRLAFAGAVVLGVTALDLVCGERLSQHTKAGGRRLGPLGRLTGGAVFGGPIKVVQSLTIMHPVDELYRFWRDFTNLPRIMKHLESVEPTDDRHSRWKAKAPLGGSVEWQSEITDDQINGRIAWRSLPGADVPNCGSVTFKPKHGAAGTVVQVELSYEPPAGAIGATFAKLFGSSPEQEIREDLRRFKQVMETGEILQSDASAKGRGSGQPPAGTASEIHTTAGPEERQ